MRDHDPALCDCLVLELVGDHATSAFVHEPVYDDDDEMVPPPIPEFTDEHDTGPLGFTVVGPLLSPRKPARLWVAKSRTGTKLGMRFDAPSGVWREAGEKSK
ncbi:MAG TPA: hypothetical protein VJZ73_13265 [Methylomirabilota bacterium]|nr:hypothetical protein [Methylomirabilota bacterium]